MNYYILESRSEKGDPVAKDIAIPASFDQFDFGQKIRAPKKPIRVSIPKPTGRALPDLIQGPYTYIIASDRLRDTFEQLEPSHVQFFPVELTAQAKVIATYHFVQVLDNVDAIDWTSSRLESYPEDKYSIVKVNKLVLNPREIDKRNCFRVQGLEAHLFVSDLFRRRIIEAGMTGMRFKPAEELGTP